MPKKQFMSGPAPLPPQNEDELTRWKEEFERFELEKLRVSNPERYRVVYPLVMRMRIQRRHGLIHE